jgi:hypothetical protein
MWRVPSLATQPFLIINSGEAPHLIAVCASPLGPSAHVWPAAGSPPPPTSP